MLPITDGSNALGTDNPNKRALALVLTAENDLLASLSSVENIQLPASAADGADDNNDQDSLSCIYGNCIVSISPPEGRGGSSST